MALDLTVLSKDVNNCISDYPVTIRHYFATNQYDQISAGLNATDDLSILQAGGLLDQMSLDIIVNRTTLTQLVQPRDRVDVLMPGGVWKQYEVKRVPDIFDPITPALSFTIGSPNM